MSFYIFDKKAKKKNKIKMMKLYDEITSGDLSRKRIVFLHSKLLLQ